jgi:hypothetical protein
MATDLWLLGTNGKGASIQELCAIHPEISVNIKINY